VLTSKIDQGLVKIVELQNFVKEIIFLGRISYSYRENPDTGIHPEITEFFKRIIQR